MDYQLKGFQVLVAEIQLTETSVILAQNPEVERFYSWYIQGSIFYESLPSVSSLVAQRLKRLPTRWETRVQSLGREDPLEKEMATHSSILAWRIPWTEEPGRLQSTGLQRVGQDWATSLSLFHLSHKGYRLPERLHCQTSYIITQKLFCGLPPPIIQLHLQPKPGREHPHTEPLSK